jgi:Uma2 family endonuclease
MEKLRTPPSLDEARARPWTRDEFVRLIELGFFRSQRVELIDGDIFEIPAPSKRRLAAICIVQHLLETALCGKMPIRALGTIDLGLRSAPDADLALFANDDELYASGLPPIPELVIQVSDSTLAHDRGPKADLFARARIPEYWIVNLKERRVEVYRQPRHADDHSPSMHYSHMQVFLGDEQVAPLAAPKARIAVSDLLL